jgi:hypothetical protein
MVLALLAVAGCARFEDRLLPVDGRDMAQDRRECQFEAVRASAGVYHPNAFIQAADRSSAEDRVRDACMRARGYRLQRIFRDANGQEIRRQTFE